MYNNFVFGTFAQNNKDGEASSWKLEQVAEE
jgi:hypothetical protein